MKTKFGGMQSGKLVVMKIRRKTKAIFCSLAFLASNTLSLSAVNASDSFQNQIQLEVLNENDQAENLFHLEVTANHNQINSLDLNLDSFGDSVAIDNISDIEVGEMDSVETNMPITFSIDQLTEIGDNDFSLSSLNDVETEMQADDAIEISNGVPSAGNNQISATVAAPDYTVTALNYVNPYPFTALGTATFSVSVRNNGDASSSSNIRCAIYVDNNSVGNFLLSPIQVNTTVSFNMSLDGIPEGTHAIKITANDNLAISESNTTNNSLTSNFSWVGQPDLIVSSLICSTSLPTVGSPVGFQFQVTNNGNGKATGTFYTDIKVDGNLIGTVSISNLEAGSTASGSYNLSFPEKKGYTITMKADCNSTVAENNENNNTKSISLTNLRIAPNITVSGVLRYKVFQHVSGASQYEFLKNYPVKIYDNATQSLKASVTTNASGAFSAVISNNTVNDGCDVYLKIPMDGNSYVKIMPQTSSDAYEFSSDIISKCQESTLNLGTISLDSTENIKGAMNIYHWIKQGKDFYTTTANTGSVGIVNVKWEPTGTLGSYQSSDTLYIVGGASADQYDADIILHEYGHYIMHYNSKSPSNAGGTHYWNAPSMGDTGTTQAGTAYSEAYAHFISSQVRSSQTVYDYSTAGTYFGGKLNTKEYHPSSGSSYIVQRIAEFYKNARMELFTAGAMYSLAQTYGFNRVNNVVMSATRNSPIDFYNGFITGSSNKATDWQYFNNYHSAFDYTLPSISVTKTSATQFTASVSDDIGVPKIDWYIDGVYRGNGNTCSIPSGLSPEYPHVVEARAFDYEGNSRGDMPRENISGTTLRTYGYESAIQQFFVDYPASSAQIILNPNNSLLSDVPDTLPEHTFVSDDMFIISNIGVGSSVPYGAGEKRQSRDASHNDIISVSNDTISVSDNTDLHITGNVYGAINSIDLVSADGQTEVSIDALYTDEYKVISGLPAGDYTLYVNKDYSGTIPFRVVVFAAPEKPDLALPEYSSETMVEVNNPYSNTVVLTTGSQQYSIQPDTSLTILLSEGENNIIYYSEKDNGVSESVNGTIFVDSISPNVVLNHVIQKNDGILINGEISEYVPTFTINGNDVILGEFGEPGQPVSFGYFIPDTEVSTLSIEATDYVGNSYSGQFEIER
jgi:hypothetical protein